MRSRSWQSMWMWSSMDAGEKLVDEVVLYCHDPAHGQDKEYRVRITETRGTWTVTAEWGRRSALIGQQTKGNSDTRWAAEGVARNLVEAKLRKGYVCAENVDPLAWLVGDADEQESRP